MKLPSTLIDSLFAAGIVGPFIWAADAAQAVNLPDGLSGTTVALLTALIAAVGAYVRERMKSRATPYEQMAKRLAQVEEQAASLPVIEARMEILSQWADEAALWMAEVEHAYAEETGEHYVPPAPLPPPPWIGTDRRRRDLGPPFGGIERRRHT